MSLFQKSYFSDLKKALKPDGIICNQAGTIWANISQVKETFRICKSVFSNVAYGVSSVPTYPTGQIGFILGSENAVSIINFHLIIIYVCYIPL